MSADADVYRGMYDAALIERCWSPDGRHLVLTTPFKSSVQSYIVDLGPFLLRRTSHRGRPRAVKNSMLNDIEFYGDGLGRDIISADSPKIEGIEGN